MGKDDYQNVKVKRSGLQKTRDVIQIVRDVLIIITLVMILLGGLFVISLVQSGKLNNIINAVDSLAGLAGGDSGSIFGDSGGSTGPNAEICDLINSARGDALSGNIASASQKLGQAEQLAKNKGLTQVTKDIGDLEEAATGGDFTTAISLLSKISTSLGC